VVEAPAGGVLARLDAYAVGVAAWRLGAGRARKEDQVRPAAGVLCLAKPGDRVSAGQPLLELRTDDPGLVPAALAALEGAWALAESAPPAAPLVLDILRG
jgi:thymidine phosphorylase